MTGFEVLETLKGRFRHQAIPSLVRVGGTQKDEAKLLQSGAANDGTRILVSALFEEEAA